LSEHGVADGREGGTAGALAEALLISDPAAYVEGVPYAEFARRRRECPVGWVEERPLWRYGSEGGMGVAGTGYWAVTRHATVTEASKDTVTFSSGCRGAFLADPKTHQDLERTRQFLINMDSPEHAKIRRFVGAAFTPRTVRLLRGSIYAHARSLADSIASGGDFDVVQDLAAELPLLVLADLLGIPRKDRRLLFEWSNNLVGFDDPEFGAGRIDVYKRTFEEAFAYASELAAVKRRRPGLDLVSELVRTGRDDGDLSEAEYRHLFVLLVVAGNETTRHLLSGGLQALVEWPAERDRIVAEPALIPLAVEELLRFVSPVMQFRRTATRDTKLDGQEIREGDKVVLYYASANRDESLFDAPDRLDLGRDPNPHLAFGTGPHFCLGAHLARLEAAVLLDVLRPHLTSLELTAPVIRLESNFMNGIKSMPARFGQKRRGG
jgi:cytochrome P450